MSTGALTPKAAVEAIYHEAIHHLNEPAQLAFLKNIYGGIQFGLTSLAALIVVGGSPSIKQANPGILMLIEGSIFSTGLILVYFSGAELYTGYPLYLTITALQRRGKPRQYIMALLTSMLGNLLGALLSATLFTYVTEALKEEPWRSYIVEHTMKSIVEPRWHTIFVKAIICGYCVTLSVLLGTQNLDGISKALALWLPFALTSISDFPHTVKYFYMIPTGMMLGAPLSFVGFLWRCVLPIMLGNAIGGALFSGVYNWWVFLHCGNGEDGKTEETFGDMVRDYRDEDD